ncbi:MAG TPA: type ISP restriction/modification enzyme, partial [Pyrinomonadaceae bacterium]
MTHLEKYLQELRDARRTGEAVKETSFYPALSNILNAVGERLSPKVRAVINLKNRGAGLPDGGLFTAGQLKKLGGDEVVREPAAFGGQQPERGVLEVKGTGEEVRAVAAGEQVTRYLKHYGQVLVTNLREFLLVERDPSGATKFLEGYVLAESERDFWRAAEHPREFAREHGARLEEYLQRVMLTRAPLDSPQSLAWFLASYARDARERIGHEQVALESLRSVREALEQALGLRFEGEQGEKFFRSTLVQTIFYGIFSAWVLWAKAKERRRGDRFDWRFAQYELHVPAISTLFEQVIAGSHVRGLNLEELLNWTADTLNRVEREKFFQKFEQAQAVQYFYEPFLEAFDPDLRKQLGVWYTPTEIVRYMVERTDRVLREELGIERGLADERVFVLDPCCGTGAYLVEVLRRIKRTIDEAGSDDLRANDLKQAATGRVFGFEILPAPFVVAHLQLGLLLQTEGVPLTEGERVGVYLTNALTGWEPPKEPKKQLPFAFHALEEERDAAEHVKRDAPVLVVIGNPPYNAFAGTSAEEEGGLVEAYKQGLVKEWGIRKFNLDDLYVRFFRLAERRIAEQTGQGVVCFISNYSWTSEPSFVVLRERLLESFDKFWIENMHGNRKISEYAPDGRTSETVFAIKGFSPGIQQGVVISTWVKSGERDGAAEILYRDDLHAAKAEARRAQLLASLDAADFDAQYTSARPDATNRYSFRPSNVGAQYLAWASLIDIASRQPFAGLSEDRRKSLIGIEREAIAERMRLYFDPNVDWETLSSLKTCLTTDVPRFDAKKARETLTKAETYQESRLVRYAIRPFDLQWCYYSPVRPLWREPRPDYWNAYELGSPVLVTRLKAAKSPEGPPIAFARQLCDYHMMPPNAFIFPVYLRSQTAEKKKKNEQQSSLLDHAGAPQNEVTANLSPRARAYLAALGVGNVDEDPDTAALVWMHALAVGYSPAYLAENADGIRADFPRVPLPATRELLE